MHRPWIKTPYGVSYHESPTEIGGCFSHRFYGYECPDGQCFCLFDAGGYLMLITPGKRNAARGVANIAIPQTRSGLNCFAVRTGEERRPLPWASLRLAGVALRC
jgi:hypothetical protein